MLKARFKQQILPVCHKQYNFPSEAIVTFVPDKITDKIPQMPYWIHTKMHISEHTYSIHPDMNLLHNRNPDKRFLWLNFPRFHTGLPFSLGYMTEYRKA